MHVAETCPLGVYLFKKLLREDQYSNRANFAMVYIAKSEAAEDQIDAACGHEHTECPTYPCSGDQYTKPSLLPLRL